MTAATTTTEEKSESCGSRAVQEGRSSSASPPPQGRQQRQKLEVYNEVLRRLKESDNEEAGRDGFDDELWSHFSRLPVRYRLLHLAHDLANRPVIEVRLVQVRVQSDRHMHEITFSAEDKPKLLSQKLEQISVKCDPDCVTIPNDGIDVWEIDLKQLKFDNMVASGSYGDLYKGTYCSQEVAIKVLKAERVNTDMQREFAQEVYIMRKVRHKNVVQFIGACTKPPSLCIVTEFMSGGSVYDYLHKHKGVFKLPSLLKVAIDISKGMNYLHQNNIIHRDLKAANLLMDENEVVKVADFGVARVKTQSGVMTAETGTYRWMAPEVIEHKPYDHKADVFSFAIVLWELLTGKLPYEYLTPLQAAVGVVQKGLRPTIPKHSNPKLADLLERCWQQDPALRPDFSEIIENLQQIAKEVGDDLGDGRKEKSHGGFLSALRRGHH
ncbi:unnamed protein product [Linum tenue]|uniref:non-specific serine/threonine protein kinase n=1 Tax=Linum tenue TaxID=586396 RepID=A0AAV0PEC4_9ROSI|nr:unnamed protein product [Linum tenue]